MEKRENKLPICRHGGEGLKVFMRKGSRVI